ncbi:PQQ-dependent sugar dehydrogenase [SAR202 cluster bacterium AD-804-J14_MRT_500m]|nr:PQQ-dependent sugar dehydrogenase [SAR202 cluster bacterium AD-804-J14_MRT_500m]
MALANPIHIAGILLISSATITLSIFSACGFSESSETFPSPTSTLMPTTVTSSHRQAESPSTSQQFNVVIEVVAKELEVPWAVDFSQDGRIFITERTGSIRILHDGVLQPEPYAKIDVVLRGEAGLMGLAVDPHFESNGFLYIYHTYLNNEGLLRNQVVRLLDHGTTGEILETILNEIPADRIHNGGRIKFGPDKKLYITTGDADNAPLAQNKASLAGKILRINPDGSIPIDNPFPGSPVYSYGHRNPQGLAWHPVTEQLFATEHGPVGHDELNIIHPGANYGWPIVSGAVSNPRFVDPLLESGLETWAPAGAVIYSNGELPSAWNNRLVFGSLRGNQLVWVMTRPPLYEDVEEVGKSFARKFGRLRDVAEGPDGYIYFTTSNMDGRGNPGVEDDLLLRIVPITGSLSAVPRIH